MAFDKNRTPEQLQNQFGQQPNTMGIPQRGDKGNVWDKFPRQNPLDPTKREPTFKMSDDNRRNLKKKETHKIDKHVKDDKKIKLEEKVDRILEVRPTPSDVSRMRTFTKGRKTQKQYQTDEIKKAEYNFSKAQQELRTLIRKIPDKAKSKQLDKQLERIVDQMINLLGSLYGMKS